MIEFSRAAATQMCTGASTNQTINCVMRLDSLVVLHIKQVDGDFHFLLLSDPTNNTYILFPTGKICASSGLHNNNNQIIFVSIASIYTPVNRCDG